LFRTLWNQLQEINLPIQNLYSDSSRFKMVWSKSKSRIFFMPWFITNSKRASSIYDFDF